MLHISCGVFVGTQRGFQSLVLQLSAVTYLLRRLAKAVTRQPCFKWIFYWLFLFSTRQCFYCHITHQCTKFISEILPCKLWSTCSFPLHLEKTVALSLVSEKSNISISTLMNSPLFPPDCSRHSSNGTAENKEEWKSEHIYFPLCFFLKYLKAGSNAKF